MKTILVVDDSKTYLTLAKQALEQDYHIMPVLSGEQALKFLEKKRPDLILLDINMPEMDGKETMRRIKANPVCSDIPVIFLTASTEPETEVACLELGATDFITKPFVPQVMRVRIARTLELEEFRRAAEQKAKRFENIASTDGLTGLWNRAYLSDKIKRVLEEGHHVAYLMLDVDHFKSVNDRFGHIVGDTVLKQLAGLLREGFPEQLVGRVGGDEFAVIIVNPPSREVLSDMITAVQAKINEGFAKTTEGIASTSIGISLAPRDGTSFQSLYDNADKALYLVKNAGKNGFRFYDVNFNAESEKGTVPLSIQTDMQLLRRQISEQGSVQGAYWQDYEPFIAIYRFMLREISRRKGYFSLVLLTVRGEDGKTPPPDICRLCMEKLHDIIRNSIRKDDVFTAYSSVQYLVVLTNTAEAAARSVIVSRIHEQFDAQCAPMAASLQYDISFMTGDELTANV